MAIIQKPNKIPMDASYEQISQHISVLRDNILANKNNLSNILIEKNINIKNENTLSELIEKVRDTLEKPKPIIYGVRVDESNSNPETSVTYIEDAIGVAPATSTSLGGWDNKFPFNLIKIVALEKGKEVVELDKNNKKFNVSGSMFVPSGYEVNVFVKFPKIYWNFTRISEDVYELRVSNVKVNENYVCYSHVVGATEKDYIYISAYYPYRKMGGGVEGDLFRSISGVKAAEYTNLSDARKYTLNTGCGVEGYTTLGWFAYCMLRILFLIAFKNLDSETCLGVGYNDSSMTTGLGDDKGFVYGSQSLTEPTVFLGLEHFIAGKEDLVDGLFVKDNSVHINFENLNYGSPSTYKNMNHTIVDDATGDGYISRVAATNELCFLPIQRNGSMTTHYCDSGYTNLSNMHTFAVGGNKVYQQKGAEGVFALSLKQHDATSSQSMSTRICYIGTDNGLPIG